MESDPSDARGARARARDWRALKNNPVTLGLATAQMRDPVSIRDLDGVTVFINEAGARSIGRQRPEDVIGHPLRDLLDDAAARQIEEDDRRVIATGETLNETRVVGIGAQRRRWRVTQIALRNRRQRIIGVLALGTELIADIPDHLLDTQQRTLALALGASELHIWSFEFARRRMQATDALCAIFGLDPVRCARLGPWRRLLHAEDRAAVERAFRESRTTGRFDVQFRIRRADGAERWLKVQSIVVREGDKLWMHGVAADITERRTNEDALRERNERLKFALDAARMSFWTLDADTRAMTVGPDFRGIVGLPAEGVVDIPAIRSLVVAADRAAVREAVEAALAGGGSFDLNARVQDCEGAIRWINAKAMAVTHENRPTRLIGVVSDVTDRMIAQIEHEQLLNREQEARSMAEAATRARDQFLAIVSHELRSPLSGIQSWTHVLESHIGSQASPPLRRAIAGVRTGVEQQVRLINDLLDATRIMSGKLSLVREPVPVLPVVEAAVASVRDQARAKGIEILSDYQVEHAQVMGDRDRLQQIVWNLLSNAVKFTPDGGHVWVRVIRQGDTLRLSVRDDGKGIPPEFQPVMFEWFRRQETTSHRSQDGLGLGLALVRHLCQLHGGTVSASSPGTGLGATFVVALPILQRVEHETLGRSVRKPVGAKAAPSLTGLRVLLVDDQGDARESLSFVLREAGAEVVVCASAAEALAALDRLGAAKAPSVLISDIAMPLQDGYWLLTQVREREEKALIPGRLPAIALTAYAQPEDRLRSLTSGFDMHVTKPVAADELITIVATAAGHILRQ